MDTKALRQKILDLAIRGKLVPQDPNDEPASVLLERIRAQKQQMVREGKLKSKDIKDDTVIFVGEDNLHYEKLADGTVKCIEEEIPFDVPKGWLWARIFSIADDLPYGTAKKSEKEGKLVVLRMGNIQSGEIDYNDLVYSSDEEDIARYSLIPGDLLFNRTNSAEWVGKTAIYRGDVPCIYAGYLIRVRTHINAEYLNAVMNSGYAKDYCNSVKTDGVNQSNINAQKLGAFLVPIPPIKEQLRIDAYIAKALPHVQAIGQNKADIAALVSLTKSKILDLAVHGQLVPHNPNDGPASVLLDRIRAEKKELVKQGIIKQDKRESGIFLGEDNSYYEKVGDQRVCIDDDLPYSLPEGWVWCELQDCCIKEIKRGRSPKYADNGHVLSFAQKCNQKTGGINMGLALLIDDSTACRYEDDEYLQDGDIVINSTGTGTLGRVGIYRATDNLAGTPVVPDSHVTVVRVSSLLDPLYFFYCLKSMQSRLETLGEGSTNQKELKPLTVQQLRIPIPPIAEQNEIVKQIVALFGHLDAIATDLT